MKGRAVIAIISMFLMLASSISAFGLSLKDIDSREISEELSVAIGENVSVPLFYTKGPVKRVATIELISGNQTQIDMINDILNKSSKIKSSTVVVENLTFRVNYTKRVLMCSRYRYMTMIVNAKDNETGNYTRTIVMNKKHEVLVTNFTGMFRYIRPKIFAPGRIRLFQPAQFVFVGSCESVVLTK